MKHFTEEKYRFWDTVIKAVSALLTVATIAIALFAYIDTRQAELKQREREYRKELSLRQLNYYSEISESIGELLTTLGYRDSIFTKTYYRQRDRFQTLYFGKMNLIESKGVDAKLQDFHGLLEKYELDNSGVTIYDLRLAAFTVNDYFRKSIQQTFEVKLEDVTK